MRAMPPHPERRTWRMPLLLFVSGAGTYLALRHRSALAFLAERNRRLLVPLVCGCFVIVPRYGLFFLAGYLFARDPRLWEAVRRQGHRNFAIAALTLPVFYASAAIPARPTWFGWDALYGIPALVVGWATLLAIAGWAQVHLTSSGPLLRYATEAVHPFCILHQTVIVVLGYHVVRWRNGLWGRYFLICGGSFVLIMAVYHLIVRPFAPTRLLFGLKPVPQGRPPPAVELAW